MNTKPPAHTKSRASGHAAGKTARLIVLIKLIEESRIDTLSKKEVSEMLGVTRWTLDRDIATIQVAREMANAMLEKLK